MGHLCTCCLGKTRTLTNGTRIRCATITPQGNFLVSSLAALSLRFRFDTAKLVLFRESTKFFSNFFQNFFLFFIICLHFNPLCYIKSLSYFIPNSRRSGSLIVKIKIVTKPAVFIRWNSRRHFQHKTVIRSG